MAKNPFEEFDRLDQSQTDLHGKRMPLWRLLFEVLWMESIIRKTEVFIKNRLSPDQLEDFEERSRRATWLQSKDEVNMEVDAIIGPWKGLKSQWLVYKRRIAELAQLRQKS